MKVLAIFSAILAVAASYPLVKTWTLSQLSNALQTKTEPALMPYLEDALNQIMYALFTSNNVKLYHAVIPSPSGAATWTVEELRNAVSDNNTSDEYRTAILQAYNVFEQRNATEELQDTVQVVIPAMDISVWTSKDLNEALKSPSTKPELIPYLEKARKELDESNEDGNVKETVGMVTFVGLIPHKADYEFIPKASKRLIKKTKPGL